jgi:N-acetylneuraminate synthase/sialic acid synthase
MHELNIAGRRVADDTDAYVIAEIGHNHQGSLEKAEQLFREAAAAGAHAAKLQKRDNKTLFTRSMYSQAYEGRNSFGATYGEHRQALEFGRSEYVHLAQLADELDLDMLSTAFDVPSVDFLVGLDLPAIKIASADVTNTPLLKYAAETGKTLIVSTGGAAMDDVRRACDTVLPINPNLALLQCTAVYPAAPADLNLAVIPSYRAEYPEVVIGFSGHDLGPELSWIAYALGARVIEKHFTLDRASTGSDHHFSLDPEQLADLCAGLERTRDAIGSQAKRCSSTEASAVLKMGKKLVAARDLPAGHVLGERDIACKSPGDGMKPYRLSEVLGRRLLVGLEMDGDIRPEVLLPAVDDGAAIAA